MSAWMTSEKHMNTLATYAYVEGLTLDPATLAKRLTLENVRSLLARYEGRYADMFEGWEDRTYKPVSLSKISPTYILKQAACFAYQACEHPGWEDSEAERMIEAIMARCKAQGGVEYGPGYDAAPWGID